MARPTLQLLIAARTGGEFARYLRRHVPRAARVIKSRLRELSIALVGDRRMSQIHQQFLREQGPTDVMSFVMDVDAAGRATGGEIVLCVPEARRRVGRRHAPVARELLLYAVHGLLHLGGMDDRTPAGFQAMHRREDEVLTRLGVGPVFGPLSR
jgi:probable rRNA maturation factor